ncbi:hypothetical protein [Chryseobacterium indoltheticum]|uniref:Uncharacterized protein n=1 Tax=Chryseobacterium indoltheticum TaxID=254 RepID=A0A381FBZ6_9FLAO|nr:hypothetical protein [Chryseobacterium indoltheticum]AZA73603.1 hypothetical protein EG358_07465 [Chryseobacterium indoltheticum]QQQ29847.1 hypothetical protein JJL46_07545 [Chryseobacterium indoltheticum]SIR23129.1 hypothetical protein SAMN05421682_11548 [Chryseobacterium indoltheticum]SUX43592.1 Uncharacterised protein [Chryseobacterium indoltheticum]
MSSTSEVGHAKNVANLQKITQQVTTYSLYNPPVENITVANLQALYTTATAKLAEAEDKRNANKNAVIIRQTAFENLKSTCTKIVNLLEILGLPQGTLDQARSMNRAIQGSSKKTTTPPEEGKKASKTASTSRQSFTQQAENFGILLQLLATIPGYTPNEEDLKLNNLTNYHASLMSSTQAVDQTEAELNTKLIERDKILYAEGAGLYTIAQNIKKYVKSLYGATSPEYTNVSAIEFTNRK